MVAYDGSEMDDFREDSPDDLVMLEQDYRAEFVVAYAECLLWVGLDWTYDGADPTPLDENYTLDDIAMTAWNDIRSACADFIDANGADLLASGNSAEQSGHDFALTRNGHGTGFWDRCYNPELPEYAPLQHLADAARVYGESDLVVGDDGELYAE